MIKTRYLRPGILFFIILLLSAVACVKYNDPQYPVYYDVSNNTSSDIKVVFKISKGADFFYTVLPDTAIIIRSGETRPIVMQLYEGSQHGNPENGDTLKTIKIIQVFNSDSTLSDKNYLLTKFWTSYLPNGNECRLTLHIHSEDFN